MIHNKYCVSHLKLDRKLVKILLNYKQLKREKQYFLFSQIGKTEHSNNDMMLSKKLIPNLHEHLFYVVCNIQSSQYKFTKYRNHLDIFYTQSHTSSIPTFFIMWLSLYKNITFMYLAILLYIMNLHCHLHL